MTALIFWDALRAMASTPDLWIGLGLMVVIGFFTIQLGRQK